MVPLTSIRRVRALICVIGLLLGLQLGSDAFSVLPMTPISRPGGNAVFRRGPQNNAGVHCPSHKSLKLERGGDICEIHAANEFCSCDISGIGSSPRDVGKKVSWLSSEDCDTCRD